LYVYEGNFNHFEYKLCQTKPNSGQPEMNITYYITIGYSNNMELLTTQKQSQTNPNYSVFIRVNSWSDSNQTQTNPIYGACPAKPSCMGRSREPACTERGRSVEPSKPILISKRIVEYKQNAYFTFARDGVYFSQYAITNRKKRLVTFEGSQASRSHVFGRMKRSYNCSRYSICGNKPADVLGGLSFLLQGRTP
jgi:hypothetical protein